MLKFSIEGASELQLIPDRLINAGYTGRDQVAVQKHVQELQEMGITAPAHTPCFFPKDAQRIQQSGRIYALDKQCSGEVAVVLLAAEDGWYVTVGCDIFDYKVEGLQADKSKYLYPNYLAKSAWPYQEVKGHWDELILRSWLGRGRERLYQEGTLWEMMMPEDMVEALKPFVKDGFAPGTVLSGGTLGCLIKGMPYASFFEFELEDPILQRKIVGTYETELLTWFQNT